MMRDPPSAHDPPAAMTAHLLVTFFCPDRTGLVSGVTGALFDLGANLGDTTFAVLGGGAEFTTICSLPDDVTADHVTNTLRALPELAEAELTVEPFTLSPEQGPTGDVTHRIVLIGGDQPGLIARLSEGNKNHLTDTSFPVDLPPRSVPGAAQLSSGCTSSLP